MKEVLEEIIELVDEASQFGKSRILLGYMDKIKTVAVEAKASLKSGLEANTLENNAAVQRALDGNGFDEKEDDDNDGQ